jgi:serine O-acetyltransferase
MLSGLGGDVTADGSYSATVRHTFPQTLRLIRSDFAFRRSLEGERPGWIRSVRLQMSPASACVLRYRLQCFFYSNRLAPLGWFCKYMNLVLYSVEIDESAHIAGGFVIGQPTAVRITGDVSIGERCVVYHQTMIGRSPFLEPEREPGPLIVGKDVIFGPGSCTYGKIEIGNGCRIGANTAVDRSFPPNTFLLGVPARVVRNPAEPKVVG